MSKEITMDVLAAMINNMDQRLSNDINGLKADIHNIKADIYDLKEGQGRIEDKLSNVAYKFDLKSLEKRVSALEG
jgi:archaellum component FlaC